MNGRDGAQGNPLRATVAALATLAIGVAGLAVGAGGAWWFQPAEEPAAATARPRSAPAPAPAADSAASNAPASDAGAGAAPAASTSGEFGTRTPVGAPGPASPPPPEAVEGLPPEGFRQPPSAAAAAPEPPAAAPAPAPAPPATSPGTPPGAPGTNPRPVPGGANATIGGLMGRPGTGGQTAPPGTPPPGTGGGTPGAGGSTTGGGTGGSTVPQVRVSAAMSSSIVSVGGQVIVRILIENATDVANVPFHLTYDPELLQFERALEGVFLKRGGQTSFMVSPIGGDRLAVGVSRLGSGKGVSGMGLVCELFFRAVGPGSANVGFVDGSVRNGSNEELPAQFVPAAIEVQQP